MSIASLLIAVSVFLGPPRRTEDVSFPRLGVLTIKAISPMYNRDQHACLTFSQPDRPLLKFNFEMANDQTVQELRWQPFPARFLVARVAGIPSPVIVATAGSHGGSDAAFETFIVAEVNGSLKEVAQRLNTSVQDSICFSTTSQVPELLVFTFSWTDEAHYGPHFFTLRTLKWNGATFLQSSVRVTKKKEPSWQAAAHELGVSCGKDVTLVLVPGER